MCGFPPQELTHRDSDPALVKEDMEVMSDFELHRLCLQFASLREFRLGSALLLDSGKLQFLTKLLGSLKEEVDTHSQTRTLTHTHKAVELFERGDKHLNKYTHTHIYIER